MPDSDTSNQTKALRLVTEIRGEVADARYQRARVHEAWVEIPLGDGWLAAFRLVRQGDEVVVGELRIFPDESLLPGIWHPGSEREPGRWSAERLGNAARVPLGGLPARTLRRIRFEDAFRWAREALQRLHEREGGEHEVFRAGGVLEEHGLARIAVEAKRRPGPRGRPDRFYAELAAAYHERVLAGTRRPIEELADELHRSTSHVRQLLAIARERGLLTATTRGRAGGSLTPKAREILERED